MFCKKCGKELKDEDKYCPYCGEPVDNDNLGQYRVYGQPENNNNNYPQYPANNDSGSAWWGILALFMPTVGLIMYFVWRRKKPKTAKVMLVGTIIGFVLNILLNFFVLDNIQDLLPTTPNEVPPVDSIPNTPSGGMDF